MAARKRKPKSNSRNKNRTIQLKSRSKKRRITSRSSRSYFKKNNIGGFLDNTISVRSLMKYSGITLAFIIIFAAVFILGRMSVADDGLTSPSGPSQLSSKSTQVLKSDPSDDVIEKEVAAVDVEEEKPAVEDVLPEEDVDFANLSEADPEPEFDYVESLEEYQEPAPACTPKVAGFDQEYVNIELDVSNFQREMRGDNWASITALKLTVTNNEECLIVNPTKVKIKMNERGKGSVWWDDDLFLPDSFRRLRPGQSISEVIPVHVSYSDVYSEKDFKLSVFDDYDIHMATFKEYITFP